MDIKIGTLVGGFEAAKRIAQIKQYGFETFAINFWQTALDGDLGELACQVKEALADSDAQISCIGVYGNPLMDDEAGRASYESFKRIIKSARKFGAELVSGFTGGIVGKSVEESIPRFKEVFSELCAMADAEGIKIVLENCPMGGTWSNVTQNLAFCPQAWELIFNALPYDNIGLQWEPCHAMTQLIDPIAQLRKWVGRIYNVHGKDATIACDVIREHGISSGHAWIWHRMPGFGDSNWTDIISILRMNGYVGSIDIEGWHDPVYRDTLEYTGQVHALRYLKQCRGGDILPCPVL